MKIYKLLIAFSFAMCLVNLQGCAVAAVGAGIAAVKYGNARKAEVKQTCLKNYNDYLKLTKNPVPLSKYCPD